MICAGKRFNLFVSRNERKTGDSGERGVFWGMICAGKRFNLFVSRNERKMRNSGEREIALQLGFPKETELQPSSEKSISERCSICA
ncbi:hypothetical protein Dimus_025662 [Dionaea muscipula]